MIEQVNGLAGPNKKQYGLYSLDFDRILITHNNLEIMKELQCILSSKQVLSLVELSTAKNWHDMLIDNSVCMNWTTEFAEVLPEFDSIITAKLITIHRSSNLIDYLEFPKVRSLWEDFKFDLVEYHNFVNFCLWVLECYMYEFKNGSSIMSEQFTIIDKFYPLPRTSLESKVKRELYLADDLNITIQLVKNLLNPIYKTSRLRLL